MERPLHPETMKMGFGCILFCAIAWERGRNLPGASSPRISLTRSLFGAQNCFPDTSGERVPESAIFHKLPQARCGRIVDGENLRTRDRNFESARARRRRWKPRADVRKRVGGCGCGVGEPGERPVRTHETARGPGGACWRQHESGFGDASHVRYQAETDGPGVEGGARPWCSRLLRC